MVATVFSTSTRNFDNRMGKQARVYLGSSELAAVVALLGRIPSPQEYLGTVSGKIQPFAGELYRYMNFDQIAKYRDKVKNVEKEINFKKISKKNRRAAEFATRRFLEFYLFYNSRNSSSASCMNVPLLGICLRGIPLVVLEEWLWRAWESSSFRNLN